jgi:hypothetical protein
LNYQYAVMNADDYLKERTRQQPLTRKEFLELIRLFRNDYLLSKDYKKYIANHRKPDVVDYGIRNELNTYLQQIQSREELRHVEKNTSEHVHTKIEDIWDENKHFRSLFESLELYCKRYNTDINVTGTHLAEYCAMYIVYRRMGKELERRRIQKQNKLMAKNYEFEERTASGNIYLKVYLKAGADFRGIANILSQLPSVRVANVTEQKASSKTDLTVYVAKAYDMEEMKKEIRIALEAYYQGSPSDPVILPTALSSISDKAYIQILDHMLKVGKGLETVRALGQKFDEETYRDYFLPSLNALSPNHSAKGEVFNRGGKTDILVFDKESNNIFIAECKLWKGEQYLKDAIDQLLSRYVNWRDEKVAIIIFNKDNKKFSDVIDKATKTVESHGMCKGIIGRRKDTSYSYIFQNPNDDKKSIKLELVLFDFS